MLVQQCILVFASILLSGTAIGQTIHRCQIDGRTTFSDKPCKASAPPRNTAMESDGTTPASADSTPSVSGYATPYGSWRGPAQYQAKIGTQLVDEAHSVVPLVISIDADSKVTGGSPGNGCKLLGIASPGVSKSLLRLDVTLSRCQYADLNRRYSGSISVRAKDKTAQLDLNAHLIRSGVPGRFFDIKATLRR